jgi:hypothetical protein
MALPFFRYSGQTTAEILASKDTCSIASLLYALEEGIMLRCSESGREDCTPAERLLLAVLALEREVNNGGFAQFFFNSSRQYAPEIVEFLNRINCTKTAALAKRAIECLGLAAVPITPDTVRAAIMREDAARDQQLNELDHEFYRLSEIEENLFRFAEEHADSFHLERRKVAPPEPKRGVTTAGRMERALLFAAPASDSFTDVREQAVKLAKAKSLAASDEDCSGAAYLYLFARYLRKGDLSAAAEVAPEAFRRCREDTAHCVAYRTWIEKLLEASKDAEADHAALRYVEYLSGEDKASQFIRKRVGFLAAVVRPNAARLPNAAHYLASNFTEADIEPPLVVYKGLRGLIRAQPDQSADQD